MRASWALKASSERSGNDSRKSSQSPFFMPVQKLSKSNLTLTLIGSHSMRLSMLVLGTLMTDSCHQRPVRPPFGNTTKGSIDVVGVA